MDIESFRRAQNSREFSTAGQQEMAASSTRLSGQVRVNGSGEARVDLPFPVKFSEKPLVTFGGEVQEGDLLEIGKMPTISVVVIGWITEEKPPYSRLYTGCTLGIVTGGASWQKMIVHWHLDGMAYTNPTT